MRFRDHTLSEDELACLARLMEEIRTNEAADERFRRDFEEFLQRDDVNLTLDKQEFRRLVEKPSARSYQKQIVLLDFVNDFFIPKLLLQEEPYSDDYTAVFRAYDDLSFMIQNKLDAHGNPLISVYARMKAHGGFIPKIYFNEFFGYRRSSNTGEVVRFYLETRKTSDPDKLTFVNEYHRNHHHWSVEGSGLYSDETLYLFGHAKDYRTEKSRGYRIMAIQPLGINELLSGLIISMDDTGPIAGRIILVPRSEHSLTEAQENEDDLISYMVRPVQSENRFQYVEEIRQNLRDVLEGYPDNYIFRLISNFTLSTVPCRPKENDTLVQRELEYRRMAHQNGWDLRIIEQQMFQALRDIPNLGPPS